MLVAAVCLICWLVMVGSIIAFVNSVVAMYSLCLLCVVLFASWGFSALCFWCCLWVVRLTVVVFCC